MVYELHVLTNDIAEQYYDQEQKASSLCDISKEVLQSVEAACAVCVCVLRTGSLSSKNHSFCQNETQERES